MFHAALVAWMSLSLPAECATHTPCDMAATCACTVPARATGSRAFYWDMTLYRDTNVSCVLESSSNHFAWLHDVSTLPDGVHAQCSGDCAHYPTHIVFRTGDMADSQGTLMLKYAVPPSDMPAHSSIRCEPSP